jgi:hypothetical protein
MGGFALDAKRHFMVNAYPIRDETPPPVRGLAGPPVPRA